MTVRITIQGTWGRDFPLNLANDTGEAALRANVRRKLGLRDEDEVILDINDNDGELLYSTHGPRGGL